MCSLGYSKIPFEPCLANDITLKLHAKLDAPKFPLTSSPFPVKYPQLSEARKHHMTGGCGQLRSHKNSYSWTFSED